MANWNKVETNDYWDPKEKGDEIIGELQPAQQGKFGSQYSILDGEQKLITLPSLVVLRTKLKAINAGTRVKIVFLGFKGEGRKYKDFEVYQDTPKVERIQ